MFVDYVIIRIEKVDVFINYIVLTCRRRTETRLYPSIPHQLDDPLPLMYLNRHKDDTKQFHNDVL